MVGHIGTAFFLMSPSTKKLKPTNHAAEFSVSSTAGVEGISRVSEDPAAFGSGRTTVCSIVENRARETCIAMIILLLLHKKIPPGLPLPGWAEIRQWAYNTQRPLYKDGDTSLSLVLTGSLGLIDRSYRDREIGVSPVGPTLATAWG